MEDKAYFSSGVSLLSQEKLGLKLGVLKFSILQYCLNLDVRINFLLFPSPPEQILYMSNQTFLTTSWSSFSIVLLSGLSLQMQRLFKVTANVTILLFFFEEIVGFSSGFDELWPSSPIRGLQIPNLNTNLGIFISFKQMLSHIQNYCYDTKYLKVVIIF